MVADDASTVVIGPGAGVCSVMAATLSTRAQDSDSVAVAADAGAASAARLVRRIHHKPTSGSSSGT
jgi:hypothetical protein